MRSGARWVKLSLSLLSAAAALLALGAREARADDDDPRKLKATYGLFGVGFHVEAGAGVYQVLGAGQMVPGIYPRAGLELHIGKHLSIPIIGRFQTAIEQGTPDVAQLSVAPGINFRLREQEWPFALVFGGAVRIGQFSVSKQLTDPSFQATPDQGTQEALGFPLAPEVTAKFEWWIVAPLCVKASVTYTPIFVAGTTVHNIEEAAAVALVF